MYRFLVILLGISCLFGSVPPANAAALLNGRYLYHFAWNGLALGTMVIEVQESIDRYSLRSEAQATGLVKIFAKHISHTRVSGLRAPRSYQPLAYESLYQTKKKKKHVTMVFDEAGKLLSEHRLPYDDRKDRSPIIPGQKSGVIDPLTALLVGRSAITIYSTNSYDFPLYDGTRLAKAVMKPGDKQSITIGKKQVEISHWIASREPIGGYTKKELAKMAEGEPPLHLYFAKDASLLPLRIELPLPVGTVTGFLVGECSTVNCPAPPDWDALKSEWGKALGTR